jgi:uncharacterized Zn finger protein (UPF0148 family)
MLMGKEPLYKNKEWLRKKYQDEQLKLKDIANICNCSDSTIAYWRRKFNISKICVDCGINICNTGGKVRCSSCHQIWRNRERHSTEWLEKKPDYMRKWEKEHKEHRAEYYKKNEKHFKIYRKKYYIKNKKRIKSYRDKWEKQNETHLDEYRKKYYIKNKKRILNRNRAYKNTSKGREVHIKVQCRRKRDLDWVKLIDNPFPDNIKIHWHHVTDKFVFPVPASVHKKTYGKNHRDKMNKWIEAHFDIRLNKLMEELKLA